MAIGDDFSVAVNGDIRHVAGTTNYTVLALHRWLQDLADDAAASTSGNDLVDIVSDTPSERITDSIINLLGTYNIDDTAAEFLYAGSISQSSGGTVYSGLRILGAVNSSSTQLTVVQDDAFYDSATAPFWGTQAGGGYNGNAAAGVLARFLVKSRVSGFDIDGQRVRVQSRHWGDTFDFFDVALGTGEAVAAISTVNDPQNDTAQGTVTAYTHVTNSGNTLIDAQDETSYDNSPTSEGTFSGGTGHATSDVITVECGCTVLVDNQTAGVVDQFTVTNTACNGADSGDTLNQISTTGSGTGFSLSPDTDNVAIDADVPVGGYQTIDINDGNGVQPYYSKWTYGADTSGDQLKAVYEFTKDIMETGTAKYSDGHRGDLITGITHEWLWDGKTGTFEHAERVVWGTDITYDTLAGGTFARGNYCTIIGTNSAAGKILYDNGSTQMRVALEDISVTLTDGDTITEYTPAGVATGVTADINVTITNNDKEGGEGHVLAYDDTDEVWIQLVHGAAPVDNLPFRGIRSGATADVNTAPTARTVPKGGGFYGTFTGSTIGAFGLGIDAGDLAFPDTVQDLDGDTNSAPNNVTFTVQGLVSGEDRVLVGTKDLTPADDFDKDQLSLNTTLNGAAETSVVCTASIPSDTPTTGTIRIQLDVLTYRRQAYTSYASATFTIASSDYTDPNDATSGNNIFVSYIDELASGSTASFTTVYSSDRTLWVRVRDGGSTPIKTFESQATLGSGGGTITAIRTSDA